MRVRRFFAADMGQAMRRVRDEIGPEAVILSNNRVAGGVEVVVAEDYDLPPASRPLSSSSSFTSAAASDRAPKGSAGRLQSELQQTRQAMAAREAREAQGGVSLVQPRHRNRQLNLDDRTWDEVLAHLQRREEARNQAPVPESSVFEESEDSGASLAEKGQGQHEDLQAMRAEIEDLKGLLRSQLASSREAVEAMPARQRQLLKAFERLGLVASLGRRLVQGVEPDQEAPKAWKTVLARLADAVPAVGEDLVDRGGILAFVGATGVGKTTTIGKLAARYVLKHGSSGVALVTTDSHRIAAHEQLRTFGRILDVPVRVVDERASLDEVLDGLRDKRLVLIDTAGMGGDEQQRMAQLRLLRESRSRLKKLLVLPATAQYRVLEAAYESVRSLGLNAVVLSKVDEAVSLGEVISAVVEWRLPLAYLADGQKVPDHIEVARATALVSRAVIIAEQNRQRRAAAGGEHSSKRAG